MHACNVVRGLWNQVCQTNRHACVFITVDLIIKLFAWGEGDSGGHVLRETTSRSLCGLVCPSCTREREIV
jgi:hypothetical protein